MQKTQHQQLPFLSTYTSGQESESEAHTAEGGHIHSLTTDNTSSTNTGGVFTRSSVGNGLHQNLDGVLLGHQVDDIESLLHNLHGVHLLTSVAAVEHQAVSQTLNERALPHYYTNSKNPPDPCGNASAGIFQQCEEDK